MSTSDPCNCHQSLPHRPIRVPGTTGWTQALDHLISECRAAAREWRLVGNEARAIEYEAVSRWLGGA